MEAQGDELFGDVDGADPVVVVAAHGVGELAPFDGAVEPGGAVDGLVEPGYELGEFGGESGSEGLECFSVHVPSLHDAHACPLVDCDAVL